MKRITAILLCVIFISTMSACGNTVRDTGKISIVTTIFPVYDWVCEIAGDSDDIEITMLIDSGVDLHSFQPTTKDILKISNCDMFVYVGGESDRWVDAAIKENKNKDTVYINLFEVLGDGRREEEIKEGMQGEEDGGDETEEEEVEYDEHIWLSIKNSELFCSAIRDGLIKIDKDNSAAYSDNASNYISKLSTLDKDYIDAVNKGSKKTLIFGDRFPFRYMTEDYGIDYYAAFVGCSAESEASFKTIKFLADKVDESDVNSIIKIDGSDGKLANTIKQNCKNKNVRILTLNSMQSVTSSQVDKGISYLEICKDNLEVLREALK